MTKSMLAAKGKAKTTPRRGPEENGAEQTQICLIRNHPVGRLAGKYKDDPIFASVMDGIHADTEAELRSLKDAE